VENVQGLHTRKGKRCRAWKLVEHGFCIKTYKNLNISGDDTAICDVSLRMSNTLPVPPNLRLTLLADLNEASVNVKPKVLKVIWIKCSHTYDLVRFIFPFSRFPKALK
jgi:hypothetical protein